MSNEFKEVLEYSLKLKAEGYILETHSNYNHDKTFTMEKVGHRLIRSIHIDEYHTSDRSKISILYFIQRLKAEFDHYLSTDKYIADSFKIGEKCDIEKVKSIMLTSPELFF